MPDRPAGIATAHRPSRPRGLSAQTWEWFTDPARSAAVFSVLLVLWSAAAAVFGWLMAAILDSLSVLDIDLPGSRPIMALCFAAGAWHSARSERSNRQLSMRKDEP